jgi:hypothetical protein
MTTHLQGKKTKKVREYGVGFEVINSILNMIKPRQPGTKRLLKLCLLISTDIVNLIITYYPILDAQGAQQ